MFENREGQSIPQVMFHTRRDHEWVDVSSDEELVTLKTPEPPPVDDESIDTGIGWQEAS
jgi:hypothetical protein